MFENAERITCGSYEVVILDDAKHHKESLAKLEEEIFTLATTSRGWDISKSSVMREKFKISPLYFATSLALIYKGQALLGIAGCDTDIPNKHNYSIIHLCSTNFSPILQGGKILSLLFGLLFEKLSENQNLEGKDLYFTAISQSPLVYSICKKFSNLYPNPNSNASEDIKTVGDAVVKKYDPDVFFDRDKLVLKSECDFFYKSLPAVADKSITEFIVNTLDVENGDVFMMVGKSIIPAINSIGKKYRKKNFRLLTKIY